MPCAYVIEDLNLLVVMTKDCSYTLVEPPPFLGGVLYENHGPDCEPIGFQIFGASLLIGCQSVREAVETIAQEVEGGMTTIFGSAAEDARTILAAHGHLRIS